MRHEIFTFESFIKLKGDLIGMGSLDHKIFGALYPQFWRARSTAADIAPKELKLTTGSIPADRSLSGSTVAVTAAGATSAPAAGSRSP